MEAPRGGEDEQAETDGESSKARGSAAAGFPLGLAALVVALSVLNRVSFKAVLVPMQSHVVQLALLASLAYCVTYVSALLARRRAGIVSDAHLAFARKSWRIYCVIGFFEATALGVSMLAARHLPGVILPLLSQLFVVYQMATGSVLLRKRYRIAHVIGVIGVGLGVSLGSWANSLANSSVDAASGALPLGPMFIYVAANGLAAIASVLKEVRGGPPSAPLSSDEFAPSCTLHHHQVLFTRYAASASDELDIFAVNSFGSMAQCACLLAVLPIGLWRAASDGVTSAIPSDPVAWATVAAYLAVNLAFNSTILLLLRRSSAVAASLTLAVATPLAAVAFCLPIPFVGQALFPAALPFALGTVLIIAGNLVYSRAGKPAVARV